MQCSKKGAHSMTECRCMVEGHDQVITTSQAFIISHKDAALVHAIEQGQMKMKVTN